MALRIKYKNYTFVSNTAEDEGEYDYRNPAHRAICEKYAYNKSQVNDMLNHGRYQDAVSYGRNYMFDDDEMNTSYHAQLNKLDSDSRLDMQTNAYLKQNNPDLYYQKEVLNNIYNLKDYRNTNPIARQVIDALNDFGKGINDKGELVTATEHELEFAPKKQYNKFFSAIFGENKFTDALKKDNDNTAAAFTQRLGIGDDELKRRGVKISYTSDGNKKYRFDHTNELAAYLIATAYDTGDRFLDDVHSFTTGVYSYDENGNLLKNSEEQQKTNYNVFDYFFDRDREIGIGSKLDKNITNKYKYTGNVYSGQLYPNSQDSVIPDNINQRSARTLYKYLRKSKVDIENELFKEENQYISDDSRVSEAIIDNDKTKPKTQIIETLQGTFDWTNPAYKIYWNSSVEDKKTDSVTSLHQAKDDKEISNLVNLIAGAKPDELTVSIMMNNGKMGVLVTRQSNEVKDNILLRGMDVEDRTTTRNTQIWIEGFVPEELQQYIQSNSYFNAIDYTNKLKQYKHYNHTFNDESRVEYDETTGMFKKYNPDDTQEYVNTSYVENRINTENIISEAIPGLYNRYANQNGGITNIDTFKQEVKGIALYAANEMYPVQITDNDANPNNIEAIMSMIGSNGQIAPKYISQFNDAQLAKLNNIYYIYYNLLQTLNWFK